MKPPQTLVGFLALSFVAPSRPAPSQSASPAYKVAQTAPASEPTYACGASSAMVVAGRHAYWIAGTELWRTDSGPEGAVIVKDFHGEARELTAVGDTVFFVAGDEALGLELWKSDGTARGTGPVARVNPYRLAPGVSLLTPLRERLLFLARDKGRPRYVVWVSDGTAEGTKPLRSVEPQPANPDSMLSTAGGAFFFTVSSSVPEGVDLWRTDGTEPGTSIAQTLPGPYHPSLVAPCGRGILFALTHYQSGTTIVDLWASDGTSSGTVMLRTLAENGLAFAANGLSSLHGGCLVGFRGDGGKVELWRTDGTPAGTARLEVIEGARAAALSAATLITPFKGEIFFVGDDGVHGAELWASDGTAAGTRMVKDINPGPGGSSPQSPLVVGDALFFAADDPIVGMELWKSDGSDAGTSLVADLCPGPCPALLDTRVQPDHLPPRLAGVDGGVVFFASTGMEGCRLWRTDGSEMGTTPVSDTDPSRGRCCASLLSSPPHVGFNGSLLFLAGEYDRWTSIARGDGETRTAQTLVSLDPWSADREYDLASVELPKGLLFARNGKVWLTDGTLAGTGQVAIPAFNRPSNAAGGRFFFWGGCDELWLSDGTPAGTRAVRSFPQHQWCAGSPIVVAGSNAFFVVDDDIHGAELWRSDGTAAGTAMVADFCPGSCTPFPVGREDLLLAPAGNRVVFRYAYQPQGTGVAASDGTPEGTQVVLPPSFYSSFHSFVPVGSMVFLLSGGYPGLSVTQWRTDGTTAGTKLLGTFTNATPTVTARPGVTVSLPYFFAADDGSHGIELWKSDGTPEGTVLVKDINPGPLSSRPTHFTEAFGRVYFAADDGEHGEELWSTDGTEAGTSLTADVLPAGRSSNPWGFTLAGRSLFFELRGPDGARELWAAKVSDLPRIDISRVFAGEGRYGNGFATFTVSLTDPPQAPVSVHYATRDGSAHAGSDYLAVSGNLTFPAGFAGPLSIAVPLLDDGEKEADEDFAVLLSDIVNAAPGRTLGVGVIFDDGTPRGSVRRRLSRPWGW